MGPQSTIVCVDDERVVLHALREQLYRQLHHEVVIELADDGESALELVASTLEEGGLVPVVITDHIMPGIKGDELVARLRVASPSSRCVMLTGQASVDAVGHALNTGGLYRFLAKPWNQDDLILTVREALRSFAQERQLAAQRSTLNEINAAALDLTASLAATDRYARLLARLTPIVGADHAAILREAGDRRGPVVVSSAKSDGPADPPADVVGRLAEIGATGELFRGTEEPFARWLWGTDRCPSVAVVPLRLQGDRRGLLVLGATRAHAFDESDDGRLAAAGALAAGALHTAELVDALEESDARRQRVVRELVRQASTLQAGVLHGESAAVRGLRTRISEMASASGTDRVLIVGAAGTGREAVARAIHAESARRDRPFILVSCAMVARPEELARSLELAHGGTVYLQGIEHLASAAARALEQAIAARTLDVRPIASTVAPSDLGAELGRWRAAAYVAMPALAERLEDLPGIADLFLRLHAARLGRGALSLSHASIERLKSYAWPGHVHELGNVIERAVLTARGSAIDVDDALLEAGQALGSYTLIEKLGAGGMGEVWRARHKHLLRPAAIKLIRSMAGTGLPPRAMERFRREVEATARLRSAHTVEIYDFGVTDSSGFYYVMELLDGMDLDALVARHGPLAPERAMFLIEQALLSLMEAHESGLIHRDIKPANLFVCRLGTEHDFVKVLDFGLVTEVGRATGERTEVDQVAGTPDFMAPEYTAGEDIDGRADLYSLGCVAFWMLTGQNVFKAKTLSAVLVAHATRPPDAPSARLGQPLPEGLDEWVLSLLEKDPQDRPASAREAHRLLSSIRLSQPWSRERAEEWWTTAATRARACSAEDDERTVDARAGRRDG